MPRHDCVASHVLAKLGRDLEALGEELRPAAESDAARDIDEISDVMSSALKVS